MVYVRLKYTCSFVFIETLRKHCQYISTVFFFFFFCRFGSFEEFKKRNVDSSGVLSPEKRLLCGLGNV